MCTCSGGRLRFRAMQVDQIILFSGDSDFVPAAKLARREGIDFILDPLWASIKPNLHEHIDGLRSNRKNYWQYPCRPKRIRSAKEDPTSRYAYPASFTPEVDEGYSVNFPDLQSCYSCGDTLVDAICMAQDVVALTLFNFERENTTPPAPSEHLTAPAGSFVNWILGNTTCYRKREECRKRKEAKENAQKP